MSSVRLEVQYSPVHPNKFITWGTELFLYEVLHKTAISDKTPRIEISENQVAHLLATSSGHHFVKCVDIYPKNEPDMLLAIGQANGKVLLSTFGPTVFDALGLAAMEFSPERSRQCNVVAWNKDCSNLLTAALDKARGDNCVRVWDILGSRSGSAVAEFGQSDSAQSVAWLYRQPKTLVVGMNNKILKVMDLRDVSKTVNACQTKAVHGVTVSPFIDYQIASYIDSQIAIWDLRSFEKPILSLPQVKPVTKILWCPTRHNLLGSLQRESRSIVLHDIQKSAEDSEPEVLERSVKPVPPAAGLVSQTSSSSTTQITSFSWHPTSENRLIAITLSGALTDYYVFERMTLNWSSLSTVAWTHGCSTINCIGADEFARSIGDLSFIMRQRAVQNYGLKTDLHHNGSLVDDKVVKGVWDWLQHSKTLIENNVIDAGPTKHPGVRSVLGLSKTNSSIPIASELQFTPWTSMNAASTAKVYKSVLRDKALHLCGWAFIIDNVLLSQKIEDLVSKDKLTKAAAYAIFGLRLKQAIKILSPNPKYSTVAMALSGFTDDKSSVWRESCESSRNQLDDPYLRAVFAFLTSDSETFENVLYEPGVAVSDRVGFALTFLSDSKLVEFLEQFTDLLTVEGNLAGVLLTGMSEEALPMFQQYIDITGDVQTASVLAIRGFPSDLIENSLVQYWINSYRDLLDTWRLWKERAQFDIWQNGALRTSSCRPEQQVYVSCNFCGKSTSLYSLAQQKKQFPRYTSAANQLKMSCCPNCRKPQPRCSICLLHMGTGSCFQPEGSSSPTRVINPFNSWYTWCQSCRHGGHAHHVMQWFKEHSECPVTACPCRCLSLDAPSILRPLKPSTS